jgi:AcrR family transcriptional regulator
MKGFFMRTKKPNQETALKILSAATEIFVEKGFEGSSINDIANKANINKSLIYHHFKDKENLWKSVKIHLLEEHAGADVSLLEFSADVPFQKFLTNVITKRYQFYRDNPSIARLVSWQNLEGSSEDIKGIGNVKLTTIASQIEEYQRRGEVRQELDSAMVSYMILYSASTPFIEMPQFFKEGDTQKSQELYLNMLIESLYLAFTTHASSLQNIPHMYGLYT